MDESCLSLPGKAYRVRRAQRAKIKGFTLAGEPRTYKALGLFAQVFQHEIDHLNGVLIDEYGEESKGG